MGILTHLPFEQSPETDNYPENRHLDDQFAGAAGPVGHLRCG